MPKFDLVIAKDAVEARKIIKAGTLLKEDGIIINKQTGETYTASKSAEEIVRVGLLRKDGMIINKETGEIIKKATVKKLEAEK